MSLANKVLHSLIPLIPGSLIVDGVQRYNSQIENERAIEEGLGGEVLKSASLFDELLGAFTIEALTLGSIASAYWAYVQEPREVLASIACLGIGIAGREYAHYINRSSIKSNLKYAKEWMTPLPKTD